MADLYIIHGWTYTVEPWKNTLEILRENGITVKMLNVPGLTEPSKKVYTIDDYVKWANQEIPDGAIALGHSNGGRILLNLCAKKPKKTTYCTLRVNIYMQPGWVWLDDVEIIPLEKK